MRRLLAAATVLGLAAISSADDKPQVDKGDAVARFSVPGMQCAGVCDANVKKALEPGTKAVTVRFEEKDATCHYDPDKGKALDLLARLTRTKQFKETQISGLGAEFDGEYAKATATIEAKKKGGKGKLYLTLEPKKDHAFNAEKDAAELEVEVTLPDGLKMKETTQKVKGGVKSKKKIDLEFDIDPKAGSGEMKATVEFKIIDVKGKDTTNRVIKLTLPVIIP
jgi:hypothetical protein